MVELTEAFVNALCAAGVHAAAAMPPETAPRLKAPAVGVSAAELETSPGGFSAYLGVQDGQELYGLRLRARMQLDVLSPTALGAAACRAALDSARAVLAEGVEGVSILSVAAHAPAYDPVGDCFRAKLEADCRCWLCAGPDPCDPAELTHFILKGALT